jgi:chromosome partitioning protein
MDDLRPTLALARRLSQTKAVGAKIVIVLSLTGRSEKQLIQAQQTIHEAGFELLDAVWPLRDGYQAAFDEGRAGSEVSNPFLKKSARAIEAEMLKLAFN